MEEALIGEILKEIYIEAFSTIWHYLKIVLASLVVLIPSIALCVYSLCTGNQIETWQGTTALIVNVFWAPIPIYYSYIDEVKRMNSLADFYVWYLTALMYFILALVIVVVFGACYLAPVFICAILCDYFDYKSGWLMLGVVIFNVLWAPGIHYVLMKIVEFVLKEKDYES